MFSFLNSLFSNKTTLSSNPPQNQILNQEILIPREEMLLDLCRNQMTQEAIFFLQLEGENINLIYDNGIFFRLAILHNNPKILSELITTYKKHTHPSNYHYLDSILKATHSIDLPIEIAKIINSYKYHTNDIYKTYKISPSLHFKQFEKFSLIQEDSNSSPFISLPLTSDSLNLQSLHEDWNLLAQKGEYGESLSIINDWHIDIDPKALIIYNCIVSTNDNNDIEKIVSTINKEYHNTYLTYILNIAQILDNQKIENIITCYIQKDKVEDEYLNEDNTILDSYLNKSFGSASTISYYDDQENLEPFHFDDEFYPT